jgi:uncharacterized protein YfaP (DUF2135 family)
MRRHSTYVLEYSWTCDFTQGRSATAWAEPSHHFISSPLSHWRSSQLEVRTSTTASKSLRPASDIRASAQSEASRGAARFEGATMWFKRQPQA